MRIGFCCSLFLLAGIANAGAPQLGGGEERVQTQDGCGIVILRSTPEAQRKAWSELAWNGACIDGLAMGMGILHAGAELKDASLSPTEGWVWYGRPFGETEARWSNGAAAKHFAWEGQRVSWNTLDASTATWSKATGMSSSVSDGPTTVTAFVNAKDEKQVYVASPRLYELVPCPPEGTSCDALWTERAGPVIRNIRAFLRENEPRARARRAQTERIVAGWKKQVGAAEVARRDDEALRMNAAVVAERAAKSAAERACTDAETAARTEYHRESTGAARKVALATALRRIYGEQCPKHANAENTLREAETLLAEAEQENLRAAAQARAAQLEQQRQQEAERQAQSAEQGRFWSGLLSAVGSAAQAYQQGVQGQAAPQAQGQRPSDGQVLAQALAEAYVSQPRDIEVTRLDFGGAASRTSCLRESIEPARVEPGQHVVAGRGNSDWLDREMYVLVNTCEEQVAVYGAACLDVVSQRSYGGGQDTGAYVAGQQVAVRGILAAGYGMKKGTKLILAYRGKEPPGRSDFESRHLRATHIAKVAWGALEFSAWERNAVPEIQSWKDNVHLALNRVEGSQPGYSLGGKSGRWPAEWSGGSCQQMSMERP
jgi:hypothetical protein